MNKVIGLLIILPSLLFSQNLDIKEATKNMQMAWSAMESTREYKELNASLLELESFSTAVNLTHSSEYQISSKTMNSYYDKKTQATELFLDLTRTKEYKNLSKSISENRADLSGASYEDIQAYAEVPNKIQKLIAKIRN